MTTDNYKPSARLYSVLFEPFCDVREVRDGFSHSLLYRPVEIVTPSRSLGFSDGSYPGTEEEGLGFGAMLGNNTVFCLRLFDCDQDAFDFAMWFNHLRLDPWRVVKITSPEFGYPVVFDIYEEYAD